MQVAELACVGGACTNVLQKTAHPCENKREALGLRSVGRYRGLKPGLWEECFVACDRGTLLPGRHLKVLCNERRNAPSRVLSKPDEKM